MNPELQNDEAVWRDRAGKGDATALGHIYDAYAERIYHYLYRRLGETALAEDLTADVFLRVVEAVGTARFCQGNSGALALPPGAQPADRPLPAGPRGAHAGGRP